MIILNQRKQRNEAVRRNLISKKRKLNGRKNRMYELAKAFIGKECLVYTVNSQLTGTVKEVTEGALLLNNGKESEILNLDYIVRIREYPRKKDGKKKSVILD